MKSLIVFLMIKTVMLGQQFYFGGSEGRRTGPINIVWNGKESDEQIEPEYFYRD